MLRKLLKVAPDGEFIAGRLSEVKSLPAREGKTGFPDGGAMLGHKSFAGRDIEAVKHQQRPAAVHTADLF